MIRTDVVELTFTGDGQTQSFDAAIEGIPISPGGRDNFTVTLRAADGTEAAMVYGVDYTYVSNLDSRGFPQSITVSLATPLSAGNKIVVERTTPILNQSEYSQNGVHPIQVENDFDNVIKILQEEEFKIVEVREALADEVVAREEADADLQAQIDTKANKDDPVKKHAPTHSLGGDDFLSPAAIGALVGPTEPDKLFLASAGGWVEYFEGGGGVAKAMVIQIQRFTADGASTDYTLDHTLKTKDVVVTVYNADTGEKVYFSENPTSDSEIVLSAALPPSAGQNFRVLLMAPGTIGSESVDPTGLVHYNENGDLFLDNDKKIIVMDTEGNISNLISIDGLNTVQVGSVIWPINLNSSIRPTIRSGVGSEDMAYMSDVAALKIPGIYSETITSDGTKTEFAVTHNLNTKNVIVQTYDGDGSGIFLGIRVANANTIILTDDAPASGTTYTVVIIGMSA